MKTQVNQRESQIHSLLQDKRSMEEIKRHLDGEIALPRAAVHGVTRDRIAAVIGEVAPRADGADSIAEAIVLLNNRPSLLIQNDTFVLPASGDWRSRLSPHRSMLERAIRSTGRVELSNSPDFDWVGTGWVIAPGVVVTNRHVALTFAAKSGQGFAFLRGPNLQMMTARLDFKEEYRTGARAEFEIQKIVWIEDLGDSHPDLALLQFKQVAGLPPALNVYRGKIDPRRDVAVIGYPARDSRNSDDAMARVFGDIFNVKRLAPGTVSGANKNDWFFTHDCSTLGGNSGSLVQDIASGEAIGLHFGGRFRQANYAVRADVLLNKLAQAKVKITVPGPGEKKKPKKKPATKEATTPAPVLASRRGYQENFLGDQFSVPLPGLKDHQSDTVEVNKQETGLKKYRLDYTHFTVVMSKSRKLCRYTAVNIDGQQLLRIPRDSDKWNFDGRIAQNLQTGNPLYANNDYDRGHMVRRLDPVWGGDASAANDDTFHFTNSCPQHALLNQKIWNDLEDYLLDNADVHNLRVNVFTGPILRPADHDYRGVLIPQDFWKVVAMVNADTLKLHATAYTLTQSHLIGDITEGFVFGQFATAQLPVAELGNLLGLDFGDLSKHDPMATAGGDELPTGERRHILRNVGHIIL